MNKPYLLAVLERAVKTAAQSALLVLGADQIDALAVSWADVAGFAAGGFVLSVLTSLATAGFGGDGPAAFGPETVDPQPARDELGQVPWNTIIGALVVVFLVVVILSLL